MLRTAAGNFSCVLRVCIDLKARSPNIGSVRAAHGPSETNEQFDARYIEYFNRCDIDGWEVRKGMTDLMGMDLIPDPKIIVAALHACRRVNDIALAIRWIESCKDRCGNETKKIFPYIMKEIRPTLEELSIPTLEELYYDTPELELKSVHHMYE